MTGAQFEQFIKFLRHSHGLGTPKEEVMDFLYDQVGNLPHEAVEWMQNRFLTLHAAKFPQVLHVAIQGLYRDWLYDHPEKRAQWATSQVAKKCNDPHCDEGLLFVYRRNDDFGYSYSSVFRCDCMRSDLAFHVSTSGKLKDAGWKMLSIGPVMKVVGKSKSHKDVDYDAVVSELESVKQYKIQHGIDDPPF